MIRTTLLVAAAAVLLAGCGGSDDDSAEEPATTAAPAETTAADGNTFQAEGIGFTFSYPDGFEQVKGDALGSVTPEPGDAQNAIKVRETAAQELPFNDYSATVIAQFEDELGTDVTRTDESHDGIDFGVLSWATKGLKSANYFFAASGKTWQLECLSTTEHRDAIDEACKQAVESISPAG